MTTEVATEATFPYPSGTRFAYRCSVNAVFVVVYDSEVVSHLDGEKRWMFRATEHQDWMHDGAAGGIVIREPDLAKLTPCTLTTPGQWRDGGRWGLVKVIGMIDHGGKTWAIIISNKADACPVVFGVNEFELFPVVPAPVEPQSDV